MPSDVLAYFLTAAPEVVELDLIEISHPDFSQTYRLVRNATEGVTVTLETAEVADFDYYPMQIQYLGDAQNLDTGIRINFGDLGEILPKELDAVHNGDGFTTKPTVIYRTYRSDDLSAPLIGPLVLEARSFSFKAEGASFEAVAPYVNLNRTGETYNLTRFPMLRGYLK